MARRRSSDSTGGRGRRRGAAVDPGPLAPWRFSLTVAAGIAVGAVRLPSIGTVGQSALDAALLRGLAAGVLVWTVLGLVNRVLRAVELAAAEAAAAGSRDEVAADAGAPGDST